MDYSGWDCFMDCDMLMKADISELWSLRDDRYDLFRFVNTIMYSRKNKIFRTRTNCLT